MTTQELRDQVIRSEGYAQGFKDGFASCARYIAESVKGEGQPPGQDSPIVPKE